MDRKRFVPTGKIKLAKSDAQCGKADGNLCDEQLETLELCLLVFKAALSAILCCYFFKEKRSKSP